MESIKDIGKMAVIGAGVMGHGIAEIYALNGYSVSLMDVDEEILEKNMALLKSELKTLVANEFTTKEACAGCGSRLICHFTPGDSAFTEASNEAGAVVGDLVRVEVDPRRSVLTGVLIFIFPILVFIAVFAAARGIVEGESYRVLGGIICLVIYFIFLKKLET